MSYPVKYFETKTNRPIIEFLSTLDEKTYGKCLKNIDVLKMYGPFLRMPYVKKITADLFELRIRGRDGIRFLFARKNNIFYLLHGFKKKRQKLLPRDIKIAKSRLTYITYML
jgi:phage-related protein